MLISQQKLTPRFKDLIYGLFRQEEKVLSDFIPNKYLYWTGSGREALRQILLNIIFFKKPKKLLKVGVPAYTCQVVLEAVKRANCQPIFYDSGIIAEIEELKKIIKKIDALILSYNFGFLPEIDKIAELCRRSNVVLIEDCAQALGATYKGKLAGSFGEHAFYSFGLSKNIGFCGGLIGSNKALKLKEAKKFPSGKLVKVIGEALISNLFFNKNLYPLTRRLLEKKLGKKQEDLNYGLPKFAKRVVLNQFKRYKKILNKRRRNAEFCFREWEGAIDFVEPIKNTEPAWLYFTILSEDKKRLASKLLKEKVELGEMRTFRCLDGGSRKALAAEKKVLTFALYRSFGEIRFIVDKLRKVVLNG